MIYLIECDVIDEINASNYQIIFPLLGKKFFMSPTLPATPST